MMPIKPRCRSQLNAEDLHTVAASIAGRGNETNALVELIRDDATRDAVLESERLLRTLLENPGLLPVSARLYFYALTRHVLVGFDRSIADYVASVLAAFVDIDRMRTMPGHPEMRADYVTDMLMALSAVSSDRAFYIRAHVGNYSLFMAGIFPDYIQRRAEVRGAPDISFYDDMARSNYRVAATIPTQSLPRASDDLRLLQ